MDKWAEHLLNNGKSENTVRSYTQRIRLFGQWFEETNGESLTPEKVTPTDLRMYKSYLQTVKRQKPQTVNLAFGAIRSWLKFHKQDVKAPPFVKEAKRAPGWLDKAQQNALLRAVERYGDKKDMAIIQVLMGGGLRVSEAANLNIEDLTIQERKGEVFVRGKGDKCRTVSLNKDVRSAITDYIGARTSGPVFLSQRGGAEARLTDSGIRQIIEKYAYLCKLDNLHPHSLRHTFAKNMLDSGVDLVTVSRLLGHESLKTTGIYTEPSDKDFALAVEKISLT